MQLLVSGFGVFDATSDNPSAHLAHALDDGAAVLKVAYRSVDEFVSSVDPAGFDAWLMLGFSAKATKLVVERTARNWCDDHPDVDGVKRPGVIEPGGPDSLPSTLWPGFLSWVPSRVWSMGDDAGGYLCNYLYYRALTRFPEKRVGFVHVPSFAAMSQRTQLDAIRVLVRRSLQPGPPARPPV